VAAAVTELPVLVERQRHTMLITLNRPQVMNCVDAQVARLVGDALAEADEDVDVRAVVVTGAGDRAFCSGADLKALARGDLVTPEDRRHWGFAGFVEHQISKPTIAAVNGLALGGGAEIVLASDLAVAAEGAVLGLPEVTRGIMAGAGGPFRLVAQIPHKVAMELLLTGEAVDARTALRCGLVNRAVPAGQVLDTAMVLADRISANAPLAVQATKRVARGLSNGSVVHERKAWEISHAELARVKASRDAKEGPLAFAERRAPRWQSR
jgi:crotonobetainyl-CoA hydratase